MTSLHSRAARAGPGLRHDGLDRVPPRFHHPTTFVLHREGAEPETIDPPPLGGGYAHELIEVTECVRAGATESAVMPLDDTLAVMTVLEQAGRQLGLTWSEDASVEI